MCPPIDRDRMRPASDTLIHFYHLAALSQAVIAKNTRVFRRSGTPEYRLNQSSSHYRCSGGLVLVLRASCVPEVRCSGGGCRHAVLATCGVTSGVPVVRRS